MSKLNRIWILAGQSWAQGACPIADLQNNRIGYLNNLRVYTATSPNITVINSTLLNNQFGDASSEFGPEFEFTDLGTYLNSDIYLLKFAIGGTYLAQTSANDWNVASVGKSYAKLNTYITNVKNFMTSRGKEYKFEGIIWEQGGADANNTTDANNYQTNLTNFINGINTHVNESNLKWYIEQCPINLNSRVGFNTVVTAQQNVVNLDIANRRLVNVDSATAYLMPDGLHPNAQGNAILGQIFINAIKQDL